MVDDFHMHLRKGKDSLQVILNKKYLLQVIFNNSSIPFSNINSLSNLKNSQIENEIVPTNSRQI